MSAGRSHRVSGMRSATLPQRRKTGLAHRRNINAQVSDLGHHLWRCLPPTRARRKALTCCLRDGGTSMPAGSQTRCPCRLGTRAVRAAGSRLRLARAWCRRSRSPVRGHAGGASQSLRSPLASSYSPRSSVSSGHSRPKICREPGGRSISHCEPSGRSP